MFLHPELGIVNYLLSLLGIWPGELARRRPRRLLDGRDGRHLAPGVVHDRAAAGGPGAAAARALRGRPHGRRLDLQAFFYVTLPLMRPVIVVTLLIRLIFAVKTFDLIFIMTRGGPGTSTDLISYFIYRSAFSA